MTGRFSVDARAFRVLLAHHLRLDLAPGGRGGAIDDSPILVQTAYNFVISFFFSAAFYARFDAFRFYFFSQALVASMTAVLCLTEFAAPLLFPRDRAILGPLPVRPQDVLAARLSALALYAGLNVASLSFIPSILAYWIGGGAGAALMAFVLFLLSGLAVPGLLVSIVALVLRLRRGHDPGEIAPVIQVGGILAVFALLVLCFGGAAGRAGSDAFPLFLALLPQAWTAAALSLAHGAPLPSTLAPFGALLAALALLFPLVAMALPALAGGGYDRALEGVPRAPGSGIGLVARGVRAVALAVARRPSERAGFGLAWAQMSRDGAFRARLFPLIGVPLALVLAAAAGRATGAAGAGEARSLFGFFFLYAGPVLFAPAIGLLPFTSGAAEASVAIRTAPLARPGEFLSGAVKAVIVRLALPYYAALALILPGGLATVADAAAAFVVAAALSMVFSFFVAALPFTREPGRLQGVVPMNASLFAMIALAVLGYAHASCPPLSLPLALYGALVAAAYALLARLARGRKGFAS